MSTDIARPRHDHADAAVLGNRSATTSEAIHHQVIVIIIVIIAYSLQRFNSALITDSFWQPPCHIISALTLSSCHSP